MKLILPKGISRFKHSPLVQTMGIISKVYIQSRRRKPTLEIYPSMMKDNLMNNKTGKLIYVAFAIRSLIHLYTLVLAIFLCKYLWDTMGNNSLLPALLSFIAIIMAFFDLRFRYRELRADKTK